MDPEFETEPEDLNEDMIEDYEPYEIDRRRRPEKTLSGSYLKWPFIIPIGLLVLILIVLFFKTGKTVPDEQFRSTVSGIENMKKNLTDLEGRIKQVQQSVAELEKSKESVSRRMDKLNNRVDQMTKNMSAASEKIQELSTAKGVSDSEVKKGYYEVRRGDTLFGIAKKHNISLDKLRQLNGLDKGKNIIPGQRLLVE